MSSAGGGEVNGKAKHNLGRDLFSIQLEVFALHTSRALQLAMRATYQATLCMEKQCRGAS